MIRWFARNDIAANFLLIAILVLGVRAALFHLPLEVRPGIVFNQIRIDMPYRGATPEDVEKTIVLPIEQALRDMPGIKRLESDASSGSANIEIEPEQSANVREMLEEVQRRIDGITIFPDESERPRITIPSTDNWWEVCTVVISGELGESDLLNLGHRVRDDLLALPHISQVSMNGNRSREISIEADPKVLEGYGLTLTDLNNAVRGSSIDLPGGSIQTNGGRILLRTKSQAYSGDDFRNIIVRAANGSEIKLGEIAKVSDGFEEGKKIIRYNGKPAIRIELMRTGDESALKISDAVQKYISESKYRFPEGITLSMWDDETVSLRGRLSTLGWSLAQGAILVLIVLGLFLRPMLAFWVVLGIPIAFAGGLLVMPFFDMTINMMSLFGFIIVVGIVVDDAIVTGENIYTKLRDGMSPLEGAVLGTKEVSTPVTFGVLTTIVAFLPLAFYDGFWGNFTKQIPPVVTGVLLFSLIASKLVLPSHLKHLKTGRKQLNFFARGQKKIADSLETAILRLYKPSLKFATEHRYGTVAFFLAIAMVSIGIWQSGKLGFVDMPSMDRDRIDSMVEMPQDTPFEETDLVVTRVVAAAQQLQSELVDPGTGEPLVQAIMSSTGSWLNGRQAEEKDGAIGIEILPPNLRSVEGPSNTEITARWRELVGPVPEARSFRIFGQRGGGRYSQDEGIEIELRGPESDEKLAVANELEALLEGYEGIDSAWTNLGGSREELEIALKPRAKDLGLTERDLATQIRQAFSGSEVQRIQRDREEIRVMVRLPENLRENLHTLDQLKITTNQGARIPFTHVATATLVDAPSRIRRIDGARSATVFAQPANPEVPIGKIAAAASDRVDAIVHKADGLSWRYQGTVAEQAETKHRNRMNWIILIIALYALLAIPFRSLLQPVFVLIAIPFGIVGALLGHLIMDITPSMLSVFGMLALAGVVVNDSLVMVDFTNRKRREGADPKEAVLLSGVSRFRPILLTSLTTFAGLMPLILDRSIQAQFLIPMAVSLAFGILFATVITLYLIPAAYLINEDIVAHLRRAWAWYRSPFRDEEAPLPDPAPPQEPS